MMFGSGIEKYHCWTQANAPTSRSQRKAMNHGSREPARSRPNLAANLPAGLSRASSAAASGRRTITRSGPLVRRRDRGATGRLRRGVERVEGLRPGVDPRPLGTVVGRRPPVVPVGQPRGLDPLPVAGAELQQRVVAAADRRDRGGPLLHGPGVELRPAFSMRLAIITYCSRTEEDSTPL